MEENVRTFGKETVFPSQVNISMLNLYVSMLLAVWLILLAFGGVHVGPEMANVAFSFVFILFFWPGPVAARR